jgi:predicted transcriptional regulator
MSKQTTLIVLSFLRGAFSGIIRPSLLWREKAMILTLTPDTEARLLALAAQRGLPPEETIDALLAEADFNDAVAGIQRGMNDYAAGRWTSLEDYEAQIQAEKQARASRLGAE